MKEAIITSTQVLLKTYSLKPLTESTIFLNFRSHVLPKLARISAHVNLENPNPSQRVKCNGAVSYARDVSSAPHTEFFPIIHHSLNSSNLISNSATIIRIQSINCPRSLGPSFCAIPLKHSTNPNLASRNL